MTSLLILLGKLIVFVSQTLNLGSGSTWPGHIVLSLNKNFIKGLIRTNNKKLKTILIAGTNGKTTTAKLIRHVLEADGKKVFQNEAGANLVNGIASTVLSNSSLTGKIDADFAIFEVDENSLPLVLDELTPDFLILLNVFRDQLDRYGETTAIVNNWTKAIQKLPNKTKLLLNADDPEIAYIGIVTNRQATYFGLDDAKLAQNTPQHASDSLYCPKCGTQLAYKNRYFSHLGDWSCPNCKLKHPSLHVKQSQTYPLSGIYNMYNTHAAILLAELNNINNLTMQQSLKNFQPAFGRQEVISYEKRKVQIFLSKNPTSFNQSLRTILEKNPSTILLILNDRIPDGRDVSWIWDTDVEELLNNKLTVIVSGERSFDIGLRLKYASSSKFLVSNFQFSMKNSNFKFQIEPDLGKAINFAIDQTPLGQTLYILPTYSAMLEARKILTGKKIL